MLSELQIRGFRRNKVLNIKLGKVTTLRGASGKGKSSAVWAMKWVATNKPGGYRFINWDGESAAVRFMLEKGKKVTRKKSKRVNYYELDGQRYEAFGAEVPEPIQNVLRLSPINFSSQHEGLFWFSKSAGEVNREMNKIVNLEVIDKTVSNLSRMQREAKVRVQMLEGKLEEYEQVKSKLLFIKEVDKELTGIETAKIELEKIEKSLSKLVNLTELVSKHKEIRDLQRQREQEGGLIVQKGRLYGKIRKNYENLLNLVEKAESYKKLKSLKIPDISGILELKSKLNQIIDKRDKLTGLVSRAEGYDGIVFQEQELVEVREIQFKKLMGKRCPLCLSKIK